MLQRNLFMAKSLVCEFISINSMKKFKETNSLLLQLMGSHLEDVMVYQMSNDEYKYIVREPITVVSMI